MANEEITPQIKGLLRYVNEHCDKNFERLGEAVKWLVEEYNNKSNK